MRGVFTALVTPFKPDLSLDLEAFKKLLKDQRSAGITGVIPCGTTGESPTLNDDEKKILISTALDELKGSGVKVLAGTGSNDTRQTVELSRWASDQGVDGLLVVTPYYNKPTQAGLESHFKAVADAVKCEVMLYNVPGRTGISLAPETVTSLARHTRIRSIKEASGNLNLTSEILDQALRASQPMNVLSGDDALYLPILSIGGTGVVSVASNLFPRAMVALQAAFEKGDLNGARQLHQRYFPLFRDLFVESNPSPVKAALEIMGFCSARVRAPLAPLSGPGLGVLKGSMERCGVTAGKPA